MKKKYMPRTGGATSSSTGAPLDENMAELVQAFLRLATPELEGTAGVNRRLKFLKIFIKLTPPEYLGNPDEPLGGLEWLQRIKQCLNLIDAPEDLRVGFATYTLTGAAGYWWEFFKRRREVKSITWAEFEELFLNKYFPETIRQAKYNEFLELTQGNMTVAEYDSKFIQLSWWHHWLAPHLVDSDEDSAEKFRTGLRPSIGKYVAIIEHKTYDDVVAAALTVEQSVDTSQRVQESFEGGCGRGEKRPRKQYICHNCGQPGHIRPNCPNNLPPSSLF